MASGNPLMVIAKDIRKEYPEKLNYTTNWDKYQNVPFWKDVDYIGIDAYFPLSENKTPSVMKLNNE